MPIHPNPSHVDGPYVDTGTGNVPFNEEPVTIVSDDGQEPTGLVPGPPAEVTYTSEDHEGEPTGAVPGPPAEVTTYEWPAQAPEAAEEPAAAAPAEEPVVEPTNEPAPAKRARKRS